MELSSALDFVYDKDVKDVCSFGIIGFESHFEIFQPSRQGSWDWECGALHWCSVIVFGVHDFEHPTVV